MVGGSCERGGCPEISVGGGHPFDKLRAAETAAAGGFLASAD